MNIKKLVLLGLPFVLITAGLIYWLVNRGQSSNITYREVPVKKDQIDINVISTGTVKPQNRLAIKPPVAGRVEQVLVREGQNVKKGQILGWMSSSERAAMLDAARSDGLEEVKRWEQNYKPTPIMAPINGTIILRNVETGQTFANTDAVFTMSDRLLIKAQVDETDIGQIKVGQDVILLLDAYPREPIKAKVSKIAFDSETVSNVTTYSVDVLPIDPPEKMRSGMTVSVNFNVSSNKNILVVPTEAIKNESGKYSVLVKSADPQHPETREVTLGISDGKRTEIKTGLNPGEIVVIAQKNLEKTNANANPFMPQAPGGRKSRR